MSLQRWWKCDSVFSINGFFLRKTKHIFLICWALHCVEIRRLVELDIRALCDFHLFRIPQLLDLGSIMYVSKHHTLLGASFHLRVHPLLFWYELVSYTPETAKVVERWLVA